MLKLDNNLLQELGLGDLPEEQKKAMLQHIYETLELRVGTNLANQMTDQQLEEFEKFIDEGGDANQAQALQWLETNLPNYKQVVNEVFEALKGEIKQMAPQIMASSSATPSTPVAQQPPAQMPTTDSYAAPQQYQQPAPQPAYQPPAPQSQFQQPAPQPSYQQPVQSDYQQPFAAKVPQSMPGQPSYQQPIPPQPAPQGFQPAPQTWQPPQPPNSQQAVDPSTTSPYSQQPPQQSV